MLDMTKLIAEMRLKQDAMQLQAQGVNTSPPSPSIFAQVLADSEPISCGKSARSALEKLGAQVREVNGGLSANVGSEYTVLVGCGSPTFIVAAGSNYVVAQNIVAAVIGHSKTSTP